MIQSVFIKEEPAEEVVMKEEPFDSESLGWEDQPDTIDDAGKGNLNFKQESVPLGKSKFIKEEPAEEVVVKEEPFDPESLGWQDQTDTIDDAGKGNLNFKQESVPLGKSKFEFPIKVEKTDENVDTFSIKSARRFDQCGNIQDRNTTYGKYLSNVKAVDLNSLLDQDMLTEYHTSLGRSQKHNQSSSVEPVNLDNLIHQGDLKAPSSQVQHSISVKDEPDCCPIPAELVQVKMEDADEENASASINIKDKPECSFCFNTYGLEMCLGFHPETLKEYNVSMEMSQKHHQSFADDMLKDFNLSTESRKIPQSSIDKPVDLGSLIPHQELIFLDNIAKPSEHGSMKQFDHIPSESGSMRQSVHKPSEFGTRRQSAHKPSEFSSMRQSSQKPSELGSMSQSGHKPLELASMRNNGHKPSELGSLRQSSHHPSGFGNVLQSSHKSSGFVSVLQSSHKSSGLGRMVQSGHNPAYSEFGIMRQSGHKPSELISKRQSVHKPPELDSKKKSDHMSYSQEHVYQQKLKIPAIDHVDKNKLIAPVMLPHKVEPVDLNSLISLSDPSDHVVTENPLGQDQSPGSNKIESMNQGNLIDQENLAVPSSEIQHSMSGEDELDNFPIPAELVQVKMEVVDEDEQHNFELSKTADHLESVAKCNICFNTYGLELCLGFHPERLPVPGVSSYKLMQSYNPSVSMEPKFFASCSVCSKQFSTAWGLSRHMQSSHEGHGKSKLPYTCPICSMTSTNKMALVKHIDTVHKNRKPYERLPKI